MAPLKMKELAEFGQSIWLDYIDRPLLETGKLKGMIEDGLRGMTSNPSIFNNAIGSTNDYDKKIIQLKDEDKSTFEIYDALTIKDIQDAADHFQGVYDDTNGLDGYVSLEINPQLANQVEASIEEGIRLFQKVDRANIMIKVPATPEGFPVVEELIAKGININVTLIFSLKQYEETAQAYHRGLTRLSESRKDLSQVRSVASVFISRLDTAVDKLLDEKLTKISDEAEKEKIQNLKGKAAVANSRMIYEKWKEISESKEFKGLSEKNANVQRILWASTGTKNPEYSDIKYITELISNPTVNTLPEKTLNAFLDHGEVKEGLNYEAAQAENILKSLKYLDIDVNDICLKLLDDGVKAFDKAFEELFTSLESKASQLSSVN